MEELFYGGGKADRTTKGKRAKKKTQKEDQACYVLITCGHPSADGKLAIEMTYEGDPILASYLLKSAQGFIEEEEEDINIS
ncbi:MAG: hypothetical protein WAM28_01725 [Chlamydiales bacterium]